MGNYDAANELYRNDGGGNFTAVTSTEITSGSLHTNAVAWGDMDGDGDLVRRRRSPTALLCACVREVRPARVSSASRCVLAGSGGGQCRQTQ